jgi:hypothetical protein
MQPTIVTESTYIVNSLVSLLHEPKNLDNQCPILDFSTMLSYSPADETTVSSVFVGAEGKGIRINTDDGRIGDIKGTKGLIQYTTYIEGLDYYFKVVTETLPITGKTLTTKFNARNNTRGCTPVLNNGLGLVLFTNGGDIIDGGYLKLVHGGVNTLTIIGEDRVIDSLVERNASIVVQYTVLVPKEAEQSFCYMVTESVQLVNGKAKLAKPIYQSSTDTEYFKPLLNFGNTILLDSGEQVRFRYTITVDPETNILDIDDDSVTGQATIQYLAMMAVDEAV